MIVQGSNNPIVLTFDSNVSDCDDLVVTCWDKTKSASGVMLKIWHKGDMQISGNMAVLPITQEDTRRFPDEEVVFAVKGLDADGETIFWDEKKVDILARSDKGIALTRSGV